MDIQKQLGTIEHVEKIDTPSSLHHLQVFNPLFSQVLQDIGGTEGEGGKDDTLQTYFEMVDMNHVKRTSYPFSEYSQPVFIKYAPLLDPLKYMTGKYDSEPEFKKQKTMTWEYHLQNESPKTKYQDLNNASYVEAFFCYLNSRLLHDYHFVHAIDFYGTFLGIQDTFRMNIGEDYDYLDNFEEFHNKVKQGEITISSYKETESDDFIDNKSQTRVVKELLTLEDNDCPTDLLNILDIPCESSSSSENNENNTSSSSEMVLEYDAKQNLENYDSESSLESDSTNSDSEGEDNSEGNDSEGEEDDSNSDDYETISDDELGELGEEGDEEGDEEDDKEEEDEDDEDEDDIIAQVKDFPVAMICLENCDGTLDSLFEQGLLNCDVCMAMAFQIIITLALYQRIFNFTHNDLHTHNIVYKNTDVETLYYCYQGKYYAVPTYGRIIKIIDFGRSVYHFRGRKFTSDGFSPTGDANSQYNTEPYYKPEKKRVEENPSFDLCRLGCSIYDFIIDQDSDMTQWDDFQKLVNQWCQDDRNKNILYKANGKERYPDFKLYKMIARAVHAHTPDNQFPQFAHFIVSEEDAQKNQHWPWMNLDAIPSFISL